MEMNTIDLSKAAQQVLHAAVVKYQFEWFYEREKSGQSTKQERQHWLRRFNQQPMKGREDTSDVSSLGYPVYVPVHFIEWDEFHPKTWQDLQSYLYAVEGIERFDIWFERDVTDTDEWYHFRGGQWYGFEKTENGGWHVRDESGIYYVPYALDFNSSLATVWRKMLTYRQWRK